MRSIWGLAALFAAAICTPAAFAQTDQKSDSAGVLAYPASFFADARPNTAYDMIKRLPGFTFDDGATARGFAGTAGNVLLDGNRPTSKTDDLQSILIRIPAADVERIDLIRGGAPGIDMHGQTVVANVIRKKGDTTRVVAMADANIFHDGHTIPGLSLQATRHAGPATYEGAIALFQNYDDSVGHGTHDIDDPNGVVLVHNAVVERGAANGLSFNGSANVPLWDGQFKGNVTLQNNPFRSFLGYTSPGFSQGFEDDTVNRNGELGLHWTGPLGGTSLETLALQRLGHVTEISTSDDTVLFDRFSSTSDTGESIIRATDRYLPMSSLTLEAGGEFAANFLIGHTSFTENGVPVLLPSANARVQELRGELFAQGSWKMTSDLLLEAGSRFEYSTISETGDSPEKRSFFYPKPRAVLTWSLDDTSQLRARYEKVLGQLDFGNFIATADLSGTGVSGGNPELRPDQHSQYELSFEKRFWDKGAFVLTLLHEQIKDVVDLVPVQAPNGTFFDAPGNIGTGTNNVIDAELTLPLDKIGIDGGLLKSSTIYRYSSVRDPTTGEKRVISSERPQAVNISFSQDIQSLRSTWGIDFFDGFDEYAYRVELIQHRDLIPPYLDTYWEYKPTSQWSIHFELDNIAPFIFRRSIFDYSGPRNTSPLESVEILKLQSQPRIYIQIRKTFE